MQFEQHGVYTVKVEDSILIVDATGPFNAELIAAYRRDVDACIQALSHAAWGQIIVLHDLSLFTPEAEQALERSLEFRKQNGLVASAVVSDSPYKMVKKQMAEIYHNVALEYAFFEDLDSAKAWLIDTIKGF